MLPGMGGRGMNPKKLQAMMRQMGIEMDDIPDVEEVIVRTKTKEIVFRPAEVSKITQQGQSSWQLSGKPVERPRSDKAPAAAPPAPAGPALGEAPKFTDADVRLVMEQAKVDRKAAIVALEEADGEVANAIVKLMDEDSGSA